MIYVKSLYELASHQIQALENIPMLAEDPRWNLDDLLKLQPPADMLLVAYIKDFAVGYLVAHCVLDEVEIYTLIVDSQRRRKGIGYYLIQALLSVCHAKHINKVFLEVGSNNQAALALYRSNGFTEVGLRKHYYAMVNGEKIDALLLCYTNHNV